MDQLPEILSRGNKPIRTAPSHGVFAAAAAPSNMFAPVDDYAYQSDGTFIASYWRTICHRKITLLVIALLGLSGGIIFSAMQVRTYQANLLLEIQGLNDNFLNTKNVTPISDPPSSGTLDDIQTQIKILQSRSLLDRVIARLNIRELRDLGQVTGRIGWWGKPADLQAAEPEAAHEVVLNTAADNLRVREVGRTRVVEVLYDSADPKIAADVANALGNEFIEQNIESRWKMSLLTSEWINRQLEDMRAKLALSEDTLKNYARRSGLIFISETNNTSEEKLRRLQEELSRAEGERFARQAQYEVAKKSAPDTLPEVLADNLLREYEAKLTDLYRQRAELGTAFTAEYSKVKSVNAQIVSLESALQRHRAAMVEQIRNQYEQAVGREKLLANDYLSQTHKVNQESQKAVQYSILKREVDSNRQLYDAMLQRMKEASVASAMRASNVRVVDPARPPQQPYQPRLFVNAAIGLFGSLFAGIGVVLLRERSDRSIRRPGELNYYLSVSELGVIGSARKERRGLGYRKRKPRNPLSTSIILDPNRVGFRELEKSGKERLELVTWQREQSAMAKSFRSVLTSIRFSGSTGNFPCVLVVTSPNPAAGKTTVASNIAIALAEINKRVLLIDADLHRPRLHTVFGVKNDRGLVDLLSAQIQPSLSVMATAQKTEVTGLYLLPSGAQSADVSTRLHSDIVSDIIREARMNFDAVLIDTPPMLEIPDARVFGRLADGVILVTRSGMTTREAAMAATQRLTDDGTVLLGTVLNDWDPKSSPSGYYPK